MMDSVSEGTFSLFRTSMQYKTLHIQQTATEIFVNTAFYIRKDLPTHRVDVLQIRLPVLRLSRLKLTFSLGEVAG